ncbi:MAG: glycosyltransferase family 4 protein [Bacteroidia bacterium]
MKVLIVATGVFLKGGIERYTRYQYAALQKILGSENVYLVSLLGNNTEGVFEEEIEVAYIQGGLTWKDKLMFIVNCIRLVKNKGIRLLIINHRQLSIIGWLSKFLYNTKYFTNVYGLEIWSGMNVIERFALLRSDALIGDCNFIINYLQKHFDYPKERMFLLYDAVDTQRFKPKEKNKELFNKYNIPSDKFLIGTIGRLARNKGHEIIIHTLKELPDNIFYIIVGGGNQMNYLKDLAKKNNVANRVIFTGRVPEDELVDFYNLMDVVVLLSTFDKNEGEGLPLGLIEASACAKPIICGNEDGSQDAISHEFKNGFLINPRSKSELKDAILKLKNDNKLCSDMGLNGRKYVLENFDFIIFTKSLENIIK